MTRTRTIAACLASALDELKPITAVVDMETTDRIDAECRAHLATLSPERRAYLEGEWK